MSAVISVALLFILGYGVSAQEKSPMVGDLAQDFELKALDGTAIKLSLLSEKGPVVIVVLRGYPGKQSEPCQKQVADLINKSSSFMNAGATVILVYPGAVDNLEDRAREFLGDKMLPNNFRIVTDPGFGFSTKYGLRRANPQDTVYPASFAINTKSVVTFALVSKGQAPRAKTEDLLKALSKTSAHPGGNKAR